MRKRETLEKFAGYTMTENKYPTLDVFMSWGFGRSTYYKVRNRYEEIKKNHDEVLRADVIDTITLYPYEVPADVKEILRNVSYLNDYDIYNNWEKTYHTPTGKGGFLCD